MSILKCVLIASVGLTTENLETNTSGCVKLFISFYLFNNFTYAILQQVNNLYIALLNPKLKTRRFS